MKSRSIKARITIVSAIAVAIIGYVAVDNYFNLKKLVGLAAETQTASLLLRQHLDGDMMHDAIRADVLKATLGLKTHNLAMIEEAKSDVAEHGARFMDNLHKNLALDLPPEIPKLFVDEEASLKTYNQQASNYMASPCRMREPAGKGFAVVASEVKNLAAQTARATEEITAQIQEMQQSTTASAEAIQAITGTIAQVNQISTAITAAVEQQGAATREISSNTTGVTRASQDTSTGTTQVLTAADELARNSVRLKRDGSDFLAEVRGLQAA